jgi:hypothetical protein
MERVHIGAALPDQHGGHGRIHAAGETDDDALTADFIELEWNDHNREIVPSRLLLAGRFRSGPHYS